jgi:hypothetical protein
MSVSLQDFGVVAELELLPKASKGRLSGYGLYLRLEPIELTKKWEYRTAIITGDDIETLPRRTGKE